MVYSFILLLLSLLLQLHGGIYLDLDVIVLREEILRLPPSLGLQQEDLLNNAVMIFSPGQPFLMRESVNELYSMNNERVLLRRTACLPISTGLATH